MRTAKRISQKELILKFKEISLTELNENFKVVDGQIYLKKPIGSLEKNGYLRIGHKGKLYLAHRLVWALEKGVFPDSILDHINGNRQDNRIENLRESTKRQNSINKKEHRNGHLPGTTFCKNRNLWQSQITINKEHIFLGRFKTQIEAHEAYIEKLKEQGI